MGVAETRYGVFLRPDPSTCLTVLRVTEAVRHQFDMVAAHVFPPHATLVGNLKSALPEEDLVALLDDVFSEVMPFSVYNHGVVRTSEGAIRCDINRDMSGAGVNANLAHVAEALRAALLPVHVRHDDHMAPNLIDYCFKGHLSLANFDLIECPRLGAEVDEFVRGLPELFPSSFEACWFELIEFRADWSSDWWQAMSWRHIKSWNTSKERAAK